MKHVKYSPCTSQSLKVNPLSPPPLFLSTSFSLRLFFSPYLSLSPFSLSLKVIPRPLSLTFFTPHSSSAITQPGQQHMILCRIAILQFQQWQLAEGTVRCVCRSWMGILPTSYPVLIAPINLLAKTLPSSIVNGRS